MKVIGISPANALIKETVFWFRPEIFLPILGIVDMGIGIGLLIKRWIPYVITVLLVHMLVTFFPMIIVEKQCFVTFPY